LNECLFSLRIKRIALGVGIGFDPIADSDLDGLSSWLTKWEQPFMIAACY